MGERAKHPVRATETTLQVVEALSEEETIGVTALANQLDVGKSAVHNHLSTLRKHGYVIKEDEGYRLSLKLLDLGGLVRSRIRLYDVAKPEVDELADETAELASLAIQEGEEGVYLYRARGEDAVDIHRHVGQHTYFTSTGLGKAMLAFLPERRVSQIVETQGIPAFTDRSITDGEELRAELETIRERGYAIDDEERMEGLRCVAAPIRTADSRLGAISVTGPISRIRGERFREELPDIVTNAANIIELNLREP